MKEADLIEVLEALAWILVGRSQSWHNEERTTTEALDTLKDHLIDAIYKMKNPNPEEWDSE